MSATILLMGHGSPDRTSLVELHELRDLVAARLQARVELSVLEFPTGDVSLLEDVLVTLPPSQRVALQPLLLFDGAHDRRDVPAIVAQAEERYGLDVRIGSAFGNDPILIELATARLRAVGAGPRDVLLFVGRGSTEASARTQTEAVGAAVAGASGLRHVVCYAGISRPDLAEGMESAIALQPSRVLALPFLLHAGVLVRRVAATLEPMARHSSVELILLPHIGNAPPVIELVATRVEALL